MFPHVTIKLNENTVYATSVSHARVSQKKKKKHEMLHV